MRSSQKCCDSNYATKVWSQITWSVGFRAFVIWVKSLRIMLSTQALRLSPLISWWSGWIKTMFSRQFGTTGKLTCKLCREPTKYLNCWLRMTKWIFHFWNYSGPSVKKTPLIKPRSSKSSLKPTTTSNAPTSSFSLMNWLRSLQTNSLRESLTAFATWAKLVVTPSLQIRSVTSFGVLL